MLFAVLTFAAAAIGQECEPQRLVSTTTSDTTGRRRCVAVDQGRVLVGANCDRAVLFGPDGWGEWLETSIVPQDAIAEEPVVLLGCDLAGDRLVHGGARATGIWLETSAAFVFDWGDSSWVETKVIAPDGTGNDHFGFVLAPDGDRLMVGAPGDNTGGSNLSNALTVRFVPKAAALSLPLPHQESRRQGSFPSPRSSSEQAVCLCPAVKAGTFFFGEDETCCGSERTFSSWPARRGCGHCSPNGSPSP